MQLVVVILTCVLVVVILTRVPVVDIHTRVQVVVTRTRVPAVTHTYVLMPVTRRLAPGLHDCVSGWW